MVSKIRRELLAILVLVVLQALFVVYWLLSQQAANCRGPDCSSAGAAAEPISRSLRALLLGPAAPPPSAAPPNWTLARPDTWDELMRILYDYIESPHARCDKSVRVGGQSDFKNRKFDGYKWMCLDPALGLLETDRCLIYSFGVDNDWLFDDSAQRLECEIHAFDPSIGEKDHQRSPRIFFHNIGIGVSNEVKTVGTGPVSERRWDVRIYENIVGFLGHQNRTVHYLRVDVDGREWDMFAHIFAHSPHLLQNVRQIGMEVHMAYGKDHNAGLDVWKSYLATFLQLERMGFRLLHSEINPYTNHEQIFKRIARRVARVYEMVWIYQPW